MSSRTEDGRATPTPRPVPSITRGKTLECRGILLCKACLRARFRYFTDESPWISIFHRRLDISWLRSAFFGCSRGFSAITRERLARFGRNFARTFPGLPSSFVPTGVVAGSRVRPLRARDRRFSHIFRRFSVYFTDISRTIDRNRLKIGTYTPWTLLYDPGTRCPHPRTVTPAGTTQPAFPADFRTLNHISECLSAS